MPRISLFVILLFLFSCDKSQKTPINKSEVVSSKKKLKVDSSRDVLYKDFKPNFKSSDIELFSFKKGKHEVEDSYEKMFYSHSRYRIDYISNGKNFYKYHSTEKMDSLGYQFSYFWYLSDEKNKILDSIRNDIKLSVEIDTTQLINYKFVDKYRGYPIYIKNTSNQWAKNSISSSFPMICEAIDKKGNWVEIEFFEPSFCGNSYMTFIMKPKSYLVSTFPLYDGDYETKVRLKHLLNGKVEYSNTIKTRIFKNHFQINALDKTAFGKPNAEINEIFH